MSIEAGKARKEVALLGLSHLEFSTRKLILYIRLPGPTDNKAVLFQATGFMWICHSSCGELGRLSRGNG